MTGRPCALGQRQNRLHLGALAVEVDRQDGLGLLADPGLDARRVDVVGRRIDIDEYRLLRQAGNRAGGGEESVGRGDHLVAGTDALGHEADRQRDRSRGDGDGMRRAAVLGQFRLALGDGRAKDALLRFKHGIHRLADFLADSGVLGLEI